MLNDALPEHGEGTISDPELLMEIMEMREAVEEAEGEEALRTISAQVPTSFLNTIYWCLLSDDDMSHYLPLCMMIMYLL
jgi:hypothetical protein